jgi:diamine N-acetyltransferase
MEEITIRKIYIEDVVTLSTLSKKTFYDTFTGTCTAADMNHFLELYYNETTIATEIADEAMCYYFAMLNNKIVGYFLYKITDPGFEETKNKKTIELKRFYITKDYFGKGIAQKMMNYFLEDAKNKNCSIAFLGVWEYNYRAQSFYNKYGFVHTNYKHNFPIGNTPQKDIYLIKALQP